MDPTRKRKLRLVVALTAALILAGALVYTSFSGATEASTPSQLRASAEPGGERLRFSVRDRDGTASVPVVYEGVVPDPFREGREVIVSGELKRGAFIAERDSLVTKCPSKFTKEKTASAAR
jgi:cytochrome c-type biogenesis protein CcmE